MAIKVVFSHCGYLKCFQEDSFATQEPSDLELTALRGFEETPKLKPNKIWDISFSFQMMLHSLWLKVEKKKGISRAIINLPYP